MNYETTTGRPQRGYGPYEEFFKQVFADPALLQAYQANATGKGQLNGDGLFNTVAGGLRGKQFASPEELSAAVKQSIGQFSPEQFAAAAKSSGDQWNQDWAAGQHDNGFFGMNPDTLAAAMALAAGSSMAMGAGGAAPSSSAFGGPGSFTGANVLGAGDLALTAMPQVTASSLGLTGAQALGASTLGMAGSGSSLVNGIKSLNDMTGGNLGAIAGGLLGAAASGDTTTSTNRDPWGPAQGYLKDNLATNANMQKYYQANPFSQEQQSAYQGLLNTNANNQANAPIMQANANSFMQSKRGAMPQMQGLLSGTQAAPIDWSKYANIGKG